MPERIPNWIPKPTVAKLHTLAHGRAIFRAQISIFPILGFSGPLRPVNSVGPSYHKSGFWYARTISVPVDKQRVVKFMHKLTNARTEQSWYTVQVVLIWLVLCGVLLLGCMTVVGCRQMDGVSTRVILMREAPSFSLSLALSLDLAASHCFIRESWPHSLILLREWDRRYIFH